MQQRFADVTTLEARRNVSNLGSRRQVCGCYYAKLRGGASAALRGSFGPDPGVCFYSPRLGLFLASIGKHVVVADRQSRKAAHDNCVFPTYIAS